MIEYGLEWHSLASYFQFKEITAPGTPQASQLRVYAKDKAGTAALYLKDDAGSEREIAPATAVTGSGAANRIAYWSAASVLTSNAAFIVDATNGRIGIGGTAPLVQLHIQPSVAAVTELRVLSGAANLRAVVNTGRTTIESCLATTGNASEFSDIVAGAGETVIRSLSSHLILTARNASGEIKFATGAADTEKMRLSSAGFLGIGTTFPVNQLHIRNPGTANAAIRIDRTEAAGTGGPALSLTKTRGSIGTEGATVSGDGLGSVFMGGHSGSDFILATARIQGFAGSTWTTSNAESYLTFSTTPSASITIAERMRLQSGGALVIGGGASQVGLTTAGCELFPAVGVGTGVAFFALGFGVGGFGNFQGRAARGTSGSPTASQLDDVIARFSGIGYGATAYASSFRAAMSHYAAENWTDSAQGTYTAFHTTPITSTTSAERLRIEASGDISHASGVRHRMLSQNRFRYLNSMARAFRGTAQSINNSTFTSINLTSESVDTDGLHDNVTNNTRLTIALTGKYLIIGFLQFATNGTGERICRLLLNGTDGLGDFGLPASASIAIVIVNSAYSGFTATNYIEIQAWQNSGGALNVDGASLSAIYLGE